MSGRPLDGVRVLDLTRVLAGPWATQLMADLGAEVIKIERPGVGDDTRGWGPPFVCSDDGSYREAAYFLSVNRGKQSVCIDLSSSEGQGLIRDLAKTCDVLVENFRPGVLARYGLDFERLHELHPSLIYCSLTGFGQDGPSAQRAAYDFMIQGMAGLMSVTGLPDGEVNGGPMKVGVALLDIITGLYACNGVLAALIKRAETGVGQHIDVALLDCAVASLANQAMNYLVTRREPGRMGNAHPSIVPYDVFPTADGAMTIAVGNDEQFSRMCTVMGRPDLATDPRFVRNVDRVKHRAILVPLLQQILRKRPTHEWVEGLIVAGVPAGPIGGLAEVFADPQVKHRGMEISLPHPMLGQTPGVACPIRFSGAPTQYDTPVPRLGEHTDAVLSRLRGRDDRQPRRRSDLDVVQ